MPRELLLVGSVPMRPAAAVFDTVSEAIGEALPRIPDGDQHGWILASLRSLQANEALKEVGRVEISKGGADLPRFGLRAGYSTDDVRFGPYGYAAAAQESYAAFVAAREAGKLRPGTRFQVTLPGPGTSSFMVDLPPEVVLTRAREALGRELAELVQVVPASELAVQIDLAMEAEHEEYRRRPEAFETPVHDTFDWTLEEMAESAGWLADRVGDEAELGFHICSIWHHYQPGGQDNAVLVDTANAVASHVTRRIDYVHIPTIPEHTAEDFAPLADLRLPDETRVYLGVIHRVDGIEGARRRIAAARAALPEFGVASFCGLGILAEGSAIRTGDSLHEDLRNAGAELEEILELHREVAALD